MALAEKRPLAAELDDIFGSGGITGGKAGGIFGSGGIVWRQIWRCQWRWRQRWRWRHNLAAWRQSRRHQTRGGMTAK
eukprot:gene13235-biopygen4393